MSTLEEVIAAANEQWLKAKTNETWAQVQARALREFLLADTTIERAALAVDDFAVDEGSEILRTDRCARAAIEAAIGGAE